MSRNTHIQFVNEHLQQLKRAETDISQVSDGYHTFNELYDARHILYIALCKELDDTGKAVVWKSRAHSNGEVWEGWFLLGINRAPGEQITFHLPMEFWGACDFCRTEDKAPDFDGHSSADVLLRIAKL